MTACLDALVSDPRIIDLGDGAKIGLYRLFHTLWSGLQFDAPLDADIGSASERTTRERLSAVRPEGREVLLLTTLEGFGAHDAALITGHSEAEVKALVSDAVAEIDRQTATRVLIIEDEPLISLDLSEIVESLGPRCDQGCPHRQPGGRGRAGGAAGPRARRHPARRRLVRPRCRSRNPRRSARCRSSSSPRFPERLLTGERPEPTFLITKPYDPNAVKAADQPGALLPHRRFDPGLTAGTPAWAGPLSSPASVAGEPVFDDARRLVLRLAVARLDQPGQLLLPAPDPVEIIVGEGAPHLALELLQFLRLDPRSSSWLPFDRTAGQRDRTGGGSALHTVGRNPPSSGAFSSFDLATRGVMTQLLDLLFGTADAASAASCLACDPRLLGLRAFTDPTTAYLAVPAAVLVFLLRRRDLPPVAARSTASSSPSCSWAR